MTIPDRAPAEGQFWLLAYLTAFLQSMSAQGYSKNTIKLYRRISHRFCDVVQMNNIGPSELDVDTMDKLADACVTTDSLCMKKKVAMVVHRFTEYLIDTGVMVRQSLVPPPGTVEHLCMELDYWLKTQRGMSSDHLRIYPKILTQFLQHCNADTEIVQNLALVTPEDVISFVDKVTVSSTWSIHYLRLILRFLFWSNYFPRDLSAIIPPTAATRNDGFPRHLEPTTVNKLLNAIHNDTPRDRRDYAMLLLMVRLGLRAKEVVAIQLDDFDWHAGQIMIRGKGHQFDYMPVPVDVGQAIIAWICDGRQGQTRHLFVRVLPPFEPLQNSRTVCSALKRAYQLAGIPFPSQVRTHSLRHSLAMKLLHQGSSLEEIGDVLRHRSYDSTTTYARHNVEDLRSIARPWPVKGGNQ